MSLKKIEIIWIFLAIFSVSYGQNSRKSYSEADAVYLNLTRTYVLNKDGSMISAVDKRQKLLTHRAFQSMYGETRINYNPKFQKILVSKSFTENNLNEKIETPANGYNDILPGFSNNLSVFSHLREMVVTHTGLEKGAIINCGYEVTTSAGNIPWLMGDDLLQADCPVEKLTIQIKVPSGQSLFYKLLNDKTAPKIDRGKEFDSYTWQFNDLPQRNREILSSFCNDQPRLLFSTMTDQHAAIHWLTDQEAFKITAGDELKKQVEQKLTGVTSPILKAMKIQEIVVSELNTTPIPATLLGYKVRTPMQVWQSNSGTTLEKSCLLSALLRAEGYDAAVCLIIPDCYKEERMPFLLVAEPVVKITTIEEGWILLSAERLNTGNFDLIGSRQAIIQLTSDVKPMDIRNEGNRIDVKGAFVIGPEGKLSGDMNGSFSNRYNPYCELLRSGGSASSLFSGLSGKAENFRSGQSNMKFSVDKGNAILSRGNFRFLDLMESGNGISSLHLNPLPYRRNSSLDLGSNLSESYHYSFTIPGGYHLANPVDLVLNKANIGKLTLRIKQKDNVIEVVRDLEITNSIITKEQYKDFRELTGQWFTSKYKQLVMIAD
jgi:hypothetical protein